nr:hypothetical protein [Tanacetum cinerariifolium]
MYRRFLQVVMDNQLDDMTTHNTRYTSLAFTQKVFANMRRVGKGFSCVETHLFASKLVQPQPQAVEEIEDQPTTPHESSMPLLTTLLETCATLSQKVAEGKIAANDADDDVTLVDVEKDEEVVTMDVESQGMINQEDVDADNKGVSVAEPTVFDDEDVTITITQTLIKLKAEKAKLLDEQIAQKLHDEENIDWSAVADQVQEKHLDWIRKYQNLKKKLVSIAQAIKNIIIYLKNMVGYKMEFFRRMIYDKVRPIFEREHKKVQTLFKPDKDVEKPKKKRVADETLLQESFKKLKAAEVSGSESTQETPFNDPKEMTEEDVQNMLEIIPVLEFKVEALQVKYPIIDWGIHTEGSRVYWKIIRVRGIIEAYQVFEDMLKGFDREYLVAL